MTEPTPQPASPARRRRHPASLGRIVATGVGASATLAIVGAMAIDHDLQFASDQPSEPEPTETTADAPRPAGPTSEQPPPTTVVRVVTVRHPVIEVPATPQPGDSSPPAAPTPAPSVSPRPAPKPTAPSASAPAPAPSTDSGGS